MKYYGNKVTIVIPHCGCGAIHHNNIINKTMVTDCNLKPWSL